MRVKSVHEAVYRIQIPYEGGGVVFLYLLKGDSVALIDTGCSDSMPLLKAALAEIDMVVSDIDLILNTHGHLDHAGGNYEVRQASGAKVHLHSADLPLVESLDAEIEFHIAPLRALEFPSAMVKAFFEESTRTADTFHRVIADLVRRMPGASKREIVLASVGELIYHMPEMLVREGGLPGSAGPTLAAHIDAALEGSYPA